MKKALHLINLLLLAASVFGQYNMQLLGKKTYSGMNLSGSWGYSDTVNNKEYALVGTTKGFSIVDITNPATPTEIKFFNGSQGLWREAQTWQHYVYITQDDNSNENSEGVLIYDLSQLPNGKADTFKGTTANDVIIKNHSLFIDEKGFLYLNGGRVNINGTGNNGTVIYDLKPNPMKPTFVGYTPSLSGSQTDYVHDCYARNDVLYEAHIYNNRFTIWDISDRSHPVKLKDFPTAYSTIHNIWLSDDSKTLFASHEQYTYPAEAYDISDLNNIQQICEFKVKPNNNEILHNIHVKDDYLICSYYSDGVAIFDASDPTNVVTIGWYDTQPVSTRTENGVWGAYGFYKSGLITASDMIVGLHVLKPTFKRAARLEGTVTDSISGNPIVGATVALIDTTISATTNSEGFYKTGTAKAGTVTVQVTKAGYNTKFITVSLSNGVKQVLNVPLSSIITGTKFNHTLDSQVDAFITGGELLVRSSALTSVKQIGLYDISGRQCLESQAPIATQTLGVSTLSKGIYFLRVNFSDEEFVVKKIVIN